VRVPLWYCHAYLRFCFDDGDKNREIFCDADEEESYDEEDSFDEATPMLDLP
jgi:hypothetical protein